MKALVVAALCAAPPAVGAAAGRGLAVRLDTGADRVVARAFVPSEAQRVGEVRLVRRGDADVVETLLYTKVLSRVVGEIRKKELANWPADRPGHADALRYIDALEDARRAIWNAMPQPTPGSDRRQKMWIDFVLAGDAAGVALGRCGLDESGPMVRSTNRQTLAVLLLDREYVQRNMRLIAADSFSVEGPALDALLAPLPRLAAAGRSGRAPTGAGR
jgi:hypothetical protein